ncbi:hypothetical protein JOC85_003617 [Bacillus mesophilus]|uniref:SMI1/KNR4 family protein n=1 Tax=Bacillus mesophilus TaxID=1808955 RepID=A0A6M0QAW9_9BACI|nr:hypothetical protein [Bacillus mesophilus]MBM7662806.1 hypothetical protein [Bacillus mesophilus]NEY73397.1 hypothetical protein [Bacillus mesophilus]
MDKNEIKKIVENEVKQLGPFVNYHGITPENMWQFLVEPFEIFVDPDDLETTPRNMWVVLQEFKNIKEGFAIVFDPYDKGWGLTEHVSDDNYVMVSGADTLHAALEGM